MFDPAKLEKFLDSLQVETHFPSKMPQKVVSLPRSPLDEKMDKYDLVVQGNFNHNHGTPEFPIYGPQIADSWNIPIYGPQIADSWNIPMYRPVQRATYSGITRQMFNITGIGVPEDPEEAPAKPVETPHSRLKAALSRLADIKATAVSNPIPAQSTQTMAPDYTHTITAWRGWEYTKGMLESLGSNSLWEQRRAPRANCAAGKDHAAPSMNCSCGYWSFKTRELLEQALERYASSVDVIGQVEIWGRVIECENGWRSEYAYPKELWLLDEGLESLSWKYGVPVRRLD